MHDAGEHRPVHAPGSAIGASRPANAGFPLGDYTPFGYLRNPSHRAESWSSCEGGNLRTADKTVGLEWTYPWHNAATAGAGLSLRTYAGERHLETRADFAKVGYTSRYHSANILSFDWQLDGIHVRARFFLADEVLRVEVAASNQSAGARSWHLEVDGRAWRNDAEPGVSTDEREARFDAGDGAAGSRVHVACGLVEVRGRGESPGTPPAGPLAPGRRPVAWTAEVPNTSGNPSERHATASVAANLQVGETVVVRAVLGRGGDVESASVSARRGLETHAEPLAAAVADDDEFYATCPVLEGDWPRGWREGLVYDFETTRLCVLPAQGIFQDVWPSWMVAWPRIVFAEGPLDMLRLSYADPATAGRAVLSMLRDAPGANVPCVFSNGAPNMVARDGSVCGTSPAWCLPFLNLHRLYLRTLDRDWLDAVYPFLAGYLRWWMEHRSNAEGWLVYRCSWEAGEDDNPRLAPGRTGDEVISEHVIPVELQATMAHAAEVMAFFAHALGKEPAERRQWDDLSEQFAARTASLFDGGQGRFRDWLIQERRFQPPSSSMADTYWGIDPRRYSALSLTPALVRQVAASDVERAALRREVVRHATAPWTSWPSWCYTLVSCALALGERALAAEVAHEVLDRVYRRTDRRSIDEYRRPTPGVSAEFWPPDAEGYTASDAYGWGATTTNLLFDCIVGLRESARIDRWALVLAPTFPAALRQPGRRLGVRRFTYRGRSIDLGLTWDPAADETLGGAPIQVDLVFDSARACQVLGDESEPVYRGEPSRTHRFRLPNAGAHTLLAP